MCNERVSAQCRQRHPESGRRVCGGEVLDMTERAHQVHPFGPVCDEHSKILILGSFPSVKSRENGFFYGHPQNRFWPVMAARSLTTLSSTLALSRASPQPQLTTILSIRGISMVDL